MPYAQTDQGNTKTISKPRADELIQEHQRLVSGRRNFESYWQSLHDYFYIEAPDANKLSQPGTELDATFLWDATTLEAADVLASGFMNYLTPPTSKWFKLSHKNPALEGNKKIADFLESVSEEVNSVINRSNFYDQMFPSYKSSGVFGTSLLFEEEDVFDDARFTNMPLRQVCIVEDAKGRVHKYFIEFEYTALQASGRWGVEALSSELNRELKEGKHEKKHKFLLYIAKRNIREIQKIDKKNMPIEACWIDIDGRTIIEESGYNEFPAMVHRFDKRPFIPWGFSPAMKALPFARILQVIAKTNLRSMMKHTDPPMALPSNAFIAPFNSNPRAVNYYNREMMDSKGIFTFGNFGDPKVGMAAIEYYTNQVKSMMFNDAFLAFNNITKEMNNPEVMERINEKMTILGPAVGRYLSEVLNPIVQRTIGILFRRGRLPDPPDELIMDPNYEIDFVGALAQAQRRSELNTLVTGLTMVGQMAQFNPNVMDMVDPDKVTSEVWNITGAPVHVLRDDDEVKKIREGRAQDSMKAQEMAMMAGGAQVAKDAGSAAAGFAKAKETNK
jgi:hypothetical protein